VFAAIGPEIGVEARSRLEFVGCNDGNPCTSDKCDKQKGCVGLPASATCTDGSVCTKGDACKAGACVAGKLIDCDDGKSCTIDSCDAATGCKHTETTEPCSDGDACTAADKCKGGKCVSGAKIVCNDANGCTDDSCDKAKGCVSAPNQASCTDANVCTIGDACKSGACAIGQIKDCDDKNGCTIDSCAPTSGCAHSNAAFTCDDGDKCTFGDVCKAGKCAAGSTLACDDGNACTDETCDKAKGCTTTANSAACSDASACTDGDTCKGGKCTAGKQKSCDDGKVCTIDSCAPATGCVNTLSTEACDDGDKCTFGDVCKGGACAPGKKLACDDGNGCTTESCDKTKGCVAAPNQASCTDANACTTKDACDKGACKAGPIKDCDDKKACTIDACSPVTGCVHTNSTLSCDDGDKCTVGDVCKSGSCQAGNALVCNDGNACTTDSCDKAKGCASVNNTANCSDGDGCTESDACKDGACSGKPKVCADDGNKCTLEGCKDGVCKATNKICPDAGPCATSHCTTKTGACGATAKADGAICEDNDKCTAGTTCKSGGCGTKVVCDDNKGCTADSCDKAKGCVFKSISEGGSCDDGNACTVGEKCASGTCKGGTTRNCNDSNPCTSDSCDTKSGCKHAAAPAKIGAAVWNDVAVHNKEKAGQYGGVALNSKGAIYAWNSDAAYWRRWQGKIVGTGGTGAKLAWKTTNRMTALGLHNDNVYGIGDDAADGKLKLWTIDDSNGKPTKALWQVKLVGASRRLAFDPAGDLYLVGNNEIRKHKVADGSVLATTGHITYPGLKSPYQAFGLAVRGGEVWSTGPKSINKWDKNLKHVATLNFGSGLSGLAFDSAGKLYAIDFKSAHRWYAVDPALGKTPTLVTGLAGPSIAFGAGGDIAVMRTDGLKVYKTSMDGPSCDDGDACTSGKFCKGTACGTKLDCDDGKACTTDSCDKAKGCINKALGDGAACDDGKPCTVDEACKSGACTGGKPNLCDDGKACTKDVCNAGKGCEHALANPEVKTQGEHTQVISHFDDFVDLPGGSYLFAHGGSPGQIYKFDKAGKLLKQGNAKPYGSFRGLAAAGGKVFSQSDSTLLLINPVDLTHKPAGAAGVKGAWHMTSNGTDTLFSSDDRVDRVALVGLDGKVTANWTVPRKQTLAWGGGFLYAGDGKTTIRKYDGAGKQVLSIQASNTALSVRPSDGALAVFGSAPNTLRVFDGSKQLFSAALAGNSIIVRAGHWSATGVIHYAMNNGTAMRLVRASLSTTTCSDGDACTKLDACNAGKCVGQAVDCDDGNAKTNDSCDAATGKCLHTL